MPCFKHNGKNINYEDKGQGRPLFILPGDTASSAVHELDIEFYSQYYRVLCPDYLGYGKSDRLEKFPTNFWWENARMLSDLMEHLGLSDVLVIGTSAGGITALALAILAKDRIAKVIADSLSIVKQNTSIFDKWWMNALALAYLLFSTLALYDIIEHIFV